MGSGDHEAVFGEELDESSQGLSWSFGGAPSTAELEEETADHFAGRYELQGVLGRGAYGVVHRALDVASGQLVALKLLDHTLDGETRQRFAREGELTASLRHPGIIGIHSGGEQEGAPFLAYELVEGQTLEEALPSLSREERLDALAEVAAALAHAHQRGVVHRDVKPANVLLDSEGRVRVADFGLATTRSLEGLTQTGAMVGTPAFMAPEQWSGAEVGPHTDVWALGVLLYLCLTDRLPFEDLTYGDLAQAVLTGRFSSARRLDPSVPPSLDALCERTLRRERPADAAAFAEALVRARAAPERTSAAVPLALALVGLGLVVVLTLAGPQPSPQVTPAAQPSLEVALTPAPSRARQASPKERGSLVERSQAALAMGEQGTALELAEEAVRHDEFDVEAHLARAAALMADRKFLAAQRDLARAAELAPDDVEVRVTRARAYASTGFPKLARNELSAALDLDPKRLDLLLLRGEMSHRLGRTKDALRDFNRVLVKLPQNAKAYQARARALLEWSGGLEQALADLEQAFSLQPKLKVEVEAAQVAARASGPLAERAQALVERAQTLR
jgi:serine/threonine protein kinase